MADSMLTDMPASKPDAAETAADDICHLWCCDEDIAMCGEDITGHPQCPHDGIENCIVCPMCGLAEDEGLPCPVPGCPGDDDDE
jgi:hypothetical protein